MIEWKQRTGSLGSAGHDAYLGGARVGWAGWNKTKADEPAYGATLSLPGYKTDLGKHETEEAARARVEKAVASWIRFAGLQVAEPLDTLANS